MANDKKLSRMEERMARREVYMVQVVKRDKVYELEQISEEWQKEHDKE